jgi:hypothetical protein
MLLLSSEGMKLEKGFPVRSYTLNALATRNQSFLDNLAAHTGSTFSNCKNLKK